MVSRVLGGGGTFVLESLSKVTSYLSSWISTATKVETAAGNAPDYYENGARSQFIADFKALERLVELEEDRWLIAIRPPTQELRAQVAKISRAFDHIHTFITDAKDFESAKSVVVDMLEEVQVTALAKRVGYFFPDAATNMTRSLPDSDDWVNVES